MNILIAPNAFKNSLTADAAATAIRLGLEESRLVCNCRNFPIGDGGDGTADLLIGHFGAQRTAHMVLDPLGRTIESFIGLLPQKTAVIELAAASGIKLLQKHEYDPLHATTFGTGQLIKFALDQKVRKIILCIGGSATVDGGMGILSALGAIFHNKAGNSVDPQPSAFAEITDIDLSQLDKRIDEVEINVLCDVHNSLLGEKGAAAVFGPQKGASSAVVKQLDAGLSNIRDVVLTKTGADITTLQFGGAAGGVAAGLHAMLKANLVSGINYFLDVTNFDRELETTDLLITGEGSIDAQTLHGKGPFGVAARAKKHSIPVIGLAGSIPLNPDPALQEYFDILLPISNDITDLDTALKNAAANLYRTAFSLGNLLSVGGSR